MLDGRFPELRLVDISLIFPACKHIQCLSGPLIRTTNHRHFREGVYKQLERLYGYYESCHITVG